MEEMDHLKILLPVGTIRKYKVLKKLGENPKERIVALMDSMITVLEEEIAEDKEVR